METLKKGCAAYLDTFAGLVRCKVLSVYKDDNRLLPSVQARIELTETKGAYKKGEILTAPQWNVPPVKAIRRTKFSMLIMPYQYQLDDTGKDTGNQSNCST